jgi:hypothetical protein
MRHPKYCFLHYAVNFVSVIRLKGRTQNNPVFRGGVKYNPNLKEGVSFAE